MAISFFAVLLFSFYFLSYTLRLAIYMLMNNYLQIFLLTFLMSLSTTYISIIYDSLPLLL